MKINLSQVNIIRVVTSFKLEKMKMLRIFTSPTPSNVGLVCQILLTYPSIINEYILDYRLFTVYNYDIF